MQMRNKCAEDKSSVKTTKNNKCKLKPEEKHLYNS